MFTLADDKILEVSYIERPPPRQRQQTFYHHRTLSISSLSSISSADYLDDEEKSLVNSHARLDDKAYEYRSYALRTYKKRHSPTSSVSSTSTASCDGVNPPPRYTHVPYNSLNEKPLPQLPHGANQRVVSFKVEKPLPPLPFESGLGNTKRWW
ncbi:hypothetical protein PVAG01_11445 [Phlyctema vagabunda]|uniref:Uncharacterized protein n=1 Tax=Phlyctema vagabunda TaxID=108571 RepID=A0ABR4P2C1_9HELO